MLIEVECTNLAKDPATNKYTECGEKIIVSSDNVGEFVSCSKCNQKVEISGNAIKKKKPKASKTKAEIPKPARKSPTSGKGKAQPKKKKKYEAVKIPINALHNMKVSKDSKETQKQVEPDFDDIDRQASHEAIVKCSACGTVCVHGRCPSCGHIMPPFDRLYKPMTEIEIRPAGFQRWFMASVGDSSNIGMLVTAGHMVFGMFIVVLIALGVACLNGFFFERQVGKDVGTWGLVATGMLTIYYILFALKSRSFLRKAGARLSWFQRPMWNFILTLARIFRWQAYDRNLKGRQVVKIKDRSFSDGRLAEMDLHKCEVLDLQRTSVTNEALKQICGLKNLKCLVLKKTQVTNEGVFRIQQARPHLWIWH